MSAGPLLPGAVSSTSTNIIRITHVAHASYVATSTASSPTTTRVDHVAPTISATADSTTDHAVSILHPNLLIVSINM